MPGEESKKETLAVLAERVGDGVMASANWLNPCSKIKLALLLSQAPACTIGEVAQAIIRDQGGTPAVDSIAHAAKVDKSHSERNAHRLFNRYGLSLRVSISWATFQGESAEASDSVTIPYLKPRDYLSLLLDKYPRVLQGGLQAGPEFARLCENFWQRYQIYHPQHVFYDRISREEWGSSIPIFIHGDKGRTLQKSPIFVLSFETPWGLPDGMLQKCQYDNLTMRRKQYRDGRLSWTCLKRCGGKRKFEDMDSCTMECPTTLLDNSAEESHQRQNNKGHSYLSRFLVAAITSKVYKKNPKVLPGILEETAAELKSLFETGVPCKRTGKITRFVFVGAKGDAEWHWEAAVFNRSYHKTGTKNELPICPQCEAGSPGLSFTDADDDPQWARTIGQTDPWDSPPPLSAVPFSDHFHAFMYKFDPFHVLKFGVFRDTVASTIVRLCLMGFFDFLADDSKGIEFRFERAFSKFQLWALAASKNPGIKHFTKANLNFGKYKCYAWLNAKGSDVTLVMLWLDFQIQAFMPAAKSPEHLRVLKAMHQTIHGGLTFVGIMHSHGLWLPKSCAQVQLEFGTRFLRGYLYLAKLCMDLRVAGFRLRPKLHYMHHLLHDIRRQLRNPECKYVFSCAALLCESNEDYIGRLARVSRRVAAKTAGLRTTQRYLVKTRALLERLHS